MYYWIDGRKHNLSRCSDSEIHALLKRFHHARSEHIFCACRRTGSADVRLPMFVRQHKATLGTSQVAAQRQRAPP